MDTGTEIRDAVKIVIQQMREHPEEFEDRRARFGWLQDTDITLLGFNEAETKAYNAALAEMRYRHFNDAVLNAMLDDVDIPQKKVTLDMLKQAAASLSKTQIQPMQVQGNSLKPAP